MNQKRRRLSRVATALLGAALAASPGACQSGEEQPSSPICPDCRPLTGGDTGDFGGIITGLSCDHVSNSEPVSVAEAAQLGFDVEALEGALARRIDAPLHWSTSDTSGGGPPSGYEEHTRITAQLRSTGVLRLVDLDPDFCDGTTCRRYGSELRQADCPPSIELGLRAEVETLDGAIRATTTGYVTRLLLEQSDDPSAFPWYPRTYFRTRVNLDRVEGELRLAPKTGGRSYRGSLSFDGDVREDGFTGSLSLSVEIELSDVTTLRYDPIDGWFPRDE